MTISRPTYDPLDYGNWPGDGPLRRGGQSVSRLPGTSPDLPSEPSKCVKEQAPALALVRDCWAGTSQIRGAGPVYLPQAPGEDPVNYRARLARAVFTNIYRNTIEGLTGYIYREDPEFGDDVPPVTVEQWENIDNAGTHGDVFIRDLTVDAMVAGHAAILVDYPQTGGAQTRGDEQALGLRPYWVPIRKDNIVSWRTTQEAGHTLLSQLVIRECTYVPDGEFGEREQERYRVFYRDQGVVGFRLLEVQKDRSVLEVGQGTYPTQEEIPVAEVRTSGSVGLFESAPPFLDLAFLNIAHYQMWSDYATSIHKTCVPIWVESGVKVDPANPEPLILGPNTARRFTDPAASADYHSHDGAALGAVKLALDDLKNDMAQLGLAALQSSKRAAETATAKELDKSASDSALAVTARGVQDAVERALGFHARYLGLDDGGSIALNREYGEQVMDAATMTAWATLATQVGVPVRMVLEALQRGQQIPEDANLDALETEMMANQVAMEAQKAQQQADQMAALQAGKANGNGKPKEMME